MTHKPPPTDAEFDIITGPLPSTRVEPPPELPKRRYAFFRIAWQLWGAGVWLLMGALAVLVTFSTKVTDDMIGQPIRYNWADRIGLWMIDHLILSAMGCILFLACFAVIGELIIQHRRRRLGGK